MDRRDLFQLLTTVRAWAQGATYAPRFFTSEQYAKLALLTEALIPEEPGSPGARSANVGYYIDTVLHHATDAVLKAQWKRGVDLLEVRYFAHLASMELTPSTEAERFFGVFKRLTIEAFLQSEAGSRFFAYKGGRAVGGFPGCPE